MTHSKAFVFAVLTIALLAAAFHINAQPLASAKIQVTGSMRAPLPGNFEVQRIGASDGAIWFQGLDHQDDIPRPAVYQWSNAGVRKMVLPQPEQDQLAITAMLTDNAGQTYIVADGSLYEAHENRFQLLDPFKGIQVKGIAGKSGLWAITARDEVYYVPATQSQAAQKRADGLGVIDHWAAGSSGDLWISVQGPAGTRLHRIDRTGSISEVRLSDDELPQVNALFADTTDALWVALADGRLARHAAGLTDWFDDGRVRLNLFQAFEDAGGSLYFLEPLTEGELSSVLMLPRSRRSDIRPEFLRARMGDLRGAVRTGAIDHLGGVWLSIGHHGAFRLQGLAELNWPRGTAIDDLPAVTPSTPQGKLSPAAARRSADATSGISGFTGARMTVLNTSRGMANNFVSCIVKDNSGSMYFTTGYENQGDDPAVAGGGISRFDHRQVTNYTTAQGLASNTVTACAYDAASNVVWFGTANGVSRFNPATSTFLSTLLAGQKVQDIVINGGDAWIGTFTNGVYRLNASTGAQVNQFNAGNNKVTSIAVDNGGTVWAGTSGTGLFTLGASFTAVATPAPGTLVQDLEVDASNNLWISMWNYGVFRRTPAGAYTQFTSAQGLGGVFASVYRTYRIQRDANNDLWFSHGSLGETGTPKAAVTFLPAAQVTAANPAFQRYSTTNGFPTNLVLALYPENATSMWFGSPGGGAWRLGGPFDASGWPQALTGSVFFNSPLLVDLDGNRDLEIVVGDNSGKVYAFRPSGALLWSYDTRNAFPGQTTGSMSVQSSVAAGDVDGDGEIDLVVGLGGQVINGTIGQGGVLILSRTGAFKRVLYTYDITNAGRSGAEDGFREGVFATPVLANVDSDPELEILVGAFDNLFYGWNADGSPIFSKDNDGDGRWDEDFLGDFTPYTPFNLSDDFPGVRFADDDGDGQTDEGSSSDDDEDGKIDEDYPEWPYNVRDTTVSSAAVFDLFGNGQKSIIFGHDYSGDSVFNRGGVLRAFDPQGNSIAGFPKGNLEQVIWSSPVVADLDNDGAYEIIHGSGLDLSTVGDAPADALIGQLVYAWRRDGTSFIAGQNGKLATTEGRTWGSFAAGDIDNDGAPELVIATTSLRNKSDQYIDQSAAVVDQTNALGQKIYAFRANGQLVPGFPVRPYTQQPGANLIGSPVLADVNSDGFLDIVVAAGPGLMAIDRNGRGISGMGIFENLQDLAYAGEVNGTPAVGDIDLDGKLELVWTQGTGNGSSSIVRVVKLGAVNSTFQRSWPMWRRGANRNGIFGPLIGLAQVYEPAGTANFNVQAFGGRDAISSVTVNLSPVGGPASLALVDNGTNGDPVANDGWFTGSHNVSAVAAGRYLLAVTLTDSAGRTDTQTLIYVRRAATAQLQISPGSLAFGTVTQGDATQLQVNIANVGNGAVNVTSIGTNNGEFTIGRPTAFPQTIPAGGVLMATVRFRPGAAGGARNATLTVQSNDPTGAAKTVPLTGSAPGGAGGCTFTLSPVTVSTVMNTGLKSTFSVIASAPSCAWTASSNRPWAQIYPLNGTGNGSIEYTVFPNFSTRTRSATFNVSGAAFNFTQNAGTGTANQRFVAQIYFNILGRLASQSEIDFQANALGTGTPRADLVWNFFNSAEFNLGGRFIAGLYVGLLNRNAEYSGWLFQRNALSTGVVKPNQLVANFIGGAEYALKFGNPSNDEYVRLLYRYVLLREASASEVQFQSGALASGVTRVQLATNFLNSNEFRIGTGPRLTAFLLYALLLQRDPSPVERAQREGQISGGAVVKDLIAEILTTQEFNALLE
jgi:hypothetical protein